MDEPILLSETECTEPVVSVSAVTSDVSAESVTESEEVSDEEDFDVPEALFSAWGSISADDDDESAETAAEEESEDALLIPDEAQPALPLFRHLQSLAENLPEELHAAYQQSELCAALALIVERLSAE